MAEIKILSGLEALSKGVDSEENGSEDGKEIAKNLAKLYKTVVAITGVIDYVSDGEKSISIKNGHEMLTSVTGTGCMTTSLIGTYAGVTKDYLISSSSWNYDYGYCRRKSL